MQSRVLQNPVPSRDKTKVVAMAGSTAGRGESFGLACAMQRLRRTFAKYLSVFD